MKTQFVFDSDICCKNNSCLRPSTGRERPIFLKFSALLGALALAGCAVGPAYQPPTVDAPAAWKESSTAPGWAPFATPADTLVRSDWWTLLGDDTLNQLAGQVGMPACVDVNADKAEGTFKKVPDRDEFGADINESLIVELYSR